MTRIHPGAPIVRETAASYRRRPLVVELHPAYLVIRQKGLRNLGAIANVDYVAVYHLGLKLRSRPAPPAPRARRRMS